MSQSTRPSRETRRKVAYWLMGLLTSMIIWMFLPGDIGQNELSLALILAPSLIGGVLGWMTGETYSDHSKRKHGTED